MCPCGPLSLTCCKPLLLTWINFNPSMDKQLYPLPSMGWNYLSFPKPQRSNRWSLEMGTAIPSHTYNECDLSSILGLKLIHVSKKGPWWLLCAGASSGKVNAAFGSGILHTIYCRLILQLSGGHSAVDLAIKCRALNLLHLYGKFCYRIKCRPLAPFTNMV